MVHLKQHIFTYFPMIRQVQMWKDSLVHVACKYSAHNIPCLQTFFVTVLLVSCGILKTCYY